MYFPAREPEIKCTHCYDTGVCIVEVENQVKMLMACDCKTPCDWHLAKRTTQPRLDFPFKWFKEFSVYILQIHKYCIEILRA